MKIGEHSLRVNEIFKSIQGETTYAGLPFVFVRLTGCNLRCSYCDTTYAYEEGTDISLNEIIETINNYKCKNVCITGGEPLLQENVYALINQLRQSGYFITIETNGSIDIGLIPKDVIRILDIKCPYSGGHDKTDLSNIERLRPSDEVKFVISSKNDYEWAKGIFTKHNLSEKSKVLFSVAYGILEPKYLAEWILNDKLNVRFQLQQHRYIWPDRTRGV